MSLIIIVSFVIVTVPLESVAIVSIIIVFPSSLVDFVTIVPLMNEPLESRFWLFVIIIVVPLVSTVTDSVTTT